MIIGITGGTGCGKTTALEAVKQLGGLVLDCDEIYHRLLRDDRTLTEAIGARFPGTVENGILDRKKLGALVFSDKKSLRNLEEMTHAAVKTEVQRLLEPRPRLAAIDAIGLFEGGLAPLCDCTVAVIAPEEVRVARLMAREGIDAAYAQKRIAAQRPQAEFAALCDYVLDNSGTRQAFYGKCLAFFRELAIIK